MKKQVIAVAKVMLMLVLSLVPLSGAVGVQGGGMTTVGSGFSGPWVYW